MNRRGRAEGSPMMLFEDLIVPLLIAIVLAAALGTWSGLSLPVATAISVGLWRSYAGVLLWSHRRK